MEVMFLLALDSLFCSEHSAALGAVVRCSDSSGSSVCSSTSYVLEGRPHTSPAVGSKASLDLSSSLNKPEAIP